LSSKGAGRVRDRGDGGASVGRGEAPKPDEVDVGAALRQLRTRRRMTIAALAAAAGLSPGAISQMESGVIQPSLTTLRRLASALDEPVFRLLLTPVSGRKVVVPRSERKVLALPGSDTRYELLTPDLGGQIEVMEVRIAPGGVSADSPLSHHGEECIVILKGRARLEVDGVVHNLRPGDAATFLGDLPHRIWSVGRGELVAISTISPPSF